MNLGTLALLAPLAAGLTPTAVCPPGGCPPAGFVPAGPFGPRPVLAAPAPLLAVKVLAPAGVRVTTRPGTPAARMFDAPPVLGLRPGYVYPIELSGLPNRPDEALYPLVEVRGSLVPRPSMSYMDYPAAITFTEVELERAALGTLITKVIFLEDPTRATPVRTTADRPLELPADTEEDALRQATENGRLVMIVRLGNRRPTDADFVKLTVPGTVFVPGEGPLSAPASPPCLGWCGVPLFDPILGPKPPNEECFPDGGDTGPRLGIGPGGVLGGLDATDVAAEYVRRGVKRVTTSNQVCVCVPRFAVRRVELAMVGVRTVTAAAAGVQEKRAGAVIERLRPEGVAGPVKPVAEVGTVRPAVQVGRKEAFTAIGYVGPARAYAVANGVRVVVGSKEVEEATNADGFVVCKDVTPKGGVRIGDEVLFTLKFTNKTGDVLTGVVLSDSLSPRLEYVPGSAESDRPTNVSTEPNEVGSQIVRFEVPGTLAPGQGGVVRFRGEGAVTIAAKRVGQRPTVGGGPGQGRRPPRITLHGCH